MTGKKSWAEKLAKAEEPEVKPCPKKFADLLPGQIMLIPTARLIDGFVRTIPPGQAMDVKQMRAAMAAQNGAEVSCPLTTGIHLRTVAEAMYEAYEAGAAADDLTPVWRVIGPKAPVLKKLTFDPDFLMDRRAAEGLPAG